MPLDCCKTFESLMLACLKWRNAGQSAALQDIIDALRGELDSPAMSQALKKLLIIGVSIFATSVIAADTNKLGRELQQVKQAEAADKANDNQNKNVKKPNNKGKR